MTFDGVILKLERSLAEEENNTCVLIGGKRNRIRTCLSCVPTSKIKERVGGRKKGTRQTGNQLKGR